MYIKVRTLRLVKWSSCKCSFDFFGLVAKKGKDNGMGPPNQSPLCAVAAVGPLLVLREAQAQGQPTLSCSNFLGEAAETNDGIHMDLHQSC